MIQEYSCVTPALMSVPNIWVYDKVDCLKRTIVPILIDVVNYCVVTTYFVRATLKAIDAKIISESRRRLQRKFLAQLMLQAGIPTILIMVPVTMIVWAVIFDVFGVQCKIW